MLANSCCTCHPLLHPCSCWSCARGWSRQFWPAGAGPRNHNGTHTPADQPPPGVHPARRSQQYNSSSSSSGRRRVGMRRSRSSGSSSRSSGRRRIGLRRSSSSSLAARSERGSRSHAHAGGSGDAANSVYDSWFAAATTGAGALTSWMHGRAAEPAVTAQCRSDHWLWL